MNKVLKDIITGLIIVIITVIAAVILRTYFFTFDKSMTDEQKKIIEKYILDINNSYLEEGMTFTSIHYFGNRYNDNELKIYLWAMFSEYDTSNNEFSIYQESSIPYVITVNIKDDNFVLLEHKIPSDGTLYKESIKELFPLTVRNKILSFYDDNEYKELVKDHNKMINTYKEYFKGGM